jgi:hypothetical protein
MINSSVMCRQQEAHHRQIAALATLENVRGIALAAANAWEAQAIEAENLEAGGRTLSDEDEAIALEFLLEEELEVRAPDEGLGDVDLTGSTIVPPVGGIERKGE